MSNFKVGDRVVMKNNHMESGTITSIESPEYFPGNIWIKWVTGELSGERLHIYEGDIKLYNQADDSIHHLRALANSLGYDLVKIEEQ